ncbi:MULTISPECIES: DUF6083 domain-containing protein [unclassified Streptomyces]|uniref:DUF6083 domain-containing protein n=2 Tax=Streptomyces TaxID=1883 RepID=UPI0020CA91C0|nr:DUF6083 domain-containing protein [Streptomyces sp. KAI 90]
MRSHLTRLHGTPHTTTPRGRPLRTAATSPGRFQTAGQTRRCCACGNPTELFPRADHRLIALHPAELATALIPEDCRWHLSAGIAHPSGDGSPWCRIPHQLVCPRRTDSSRSRPHLDALRLRLALRTRRLIDTGLLTPALHPPTPPSTTPARPVVRVLLNLYLASTPLEDIRCIAQRPPRPPCGQRILDAGFPTGTWRLLPVGHQTNRGQSPPPMAVYDLDRLDPVQQLRWRAQHCPDHVAVPVELDHTEWQVFDPLLHADHIHTQLPPPSRRPCQGT